MTTLELFKAIGNKAAETKSALTKSYFSEDKSFYNQLLKQFPKAQINNSVYETINNLSSMYAKSLEY